MTIELPKKKVKATRKDPKSIVIFSQYKVGKSTAASGLDNALIIDIEDGTNFLDAVKYDVVEKAKKEDVPPIIILKKLINEIKAENEKAGKYVYKYGILDTVSALEDIAKPLAKKFYQSTPMGRNWVGDDVTTLPNGAGWLFQRNAVLTVLNELEEVFDTLIILGHVKDKAVEKEGKEIDERSLDLTGKLASIVCSKVDTVGYMYRKENETIINFKPSERLICGSRSEHLRDKEITVVTSDENKNLTIDWSKIFID